MVPRLAAEGTSFHGAYLYYFHDKNSLTQARVAWTETINMLTDKVEKAWKVMAFTAKHQDQLKAATGQKRSGARLKKAVLAYSLSWHPEQKPDRETMMEAARSSLEQLGLSEHEAMVACHIDEPQPHIHLVVNKTHPRTGLVAKLKFTKRKLSNWARKFQKAEGTEYCPKREENYQMRKKGMKTVYGDPNIIEAWERSQRGSEFVAELKARGYELAKGRKRPVIVDPHGKTVNPVRMLPDVKAAEFNARISDIDTGALPTPSQVLKARAKANAEVSPFEPDAPSPANRANREHDDRLAAFEVKTAKAMERLRLKQAQQLEKARLLSQERIETKRREFADKLSIAERQSAIDALREKLARPTLVPRFARRLLGLDRKATTKLKRLLAAQAKATTQMDRKMRRNARNEERITQKLKQRQSVERRELLQRFEKWRPRASSRRQQERGPCGHPLHIEAIPGCRIK